MMDETYVECLVKRKTPTHLRFLQILMVMLAAAFIVLGILRIEALLIGAVMAVASHYFKINSDVEYEYLYLDKEITIDKVLAKTRRKQAATYDMEAMEIFAPINSHRLDGHRNRQVKTVDYSSGVEQQPEKRYAMYYEGGIRVILEPSPQFVKAMKNGAPRKVFTD